MKKFNCPYCGNPMSKGGTKCRPCAVSMRYLSPEARSRMGFRRFGPDNPQWKGAEVGYQSLHEWVKVYFVKPELCECCKKKPPMDLANISGNYLRDLSDWEYLCRSCHMRKDGRLKNVMDNNLMVGNKPGPQKLIEAE